MVHRSSPPEWPPRSAADFPRIARLPEYLFDRVNAEKAEQIARGRDVIDLGMGNPDLPTSEAVVRRLVESAGVGAQHGYSPSRGIPELREAIAGHYRQRYGVELDPDAEVVVTIGAQEGISHLMLALLDAGDEVLVPAPCYPIHSYSVGFAGGRVRHLPLEGTGDGRLRSDALLAAVEQAVASTTPAPKALLLSFPNNPTALVADLSFFENAVELCRRNRLILIHDFAYADIGFDATQPPSLLQARGAKEIGVEFFSMSKSYSMAGWRVGFCVGNGAIVQALTRMKSYLDYGIFQPIQHAAVEALNSGPDEATRAREVYRSRRDAFVEALRENGWEVPIPRGSMFVWAPIPPAFEAMGSMEFARLLLREAGVASSPGVGFGVEGEGFLRLALVEEEGRLREAAERIGRVIRGR